MKDSKITSDKSGAKKARKSRPRKTKQEPAPDLPESTGEENVNEQPDQVQPEPPKPHADLVPEAICDLLMSSESVNELSISIVKHRPDLSGEVSECNAYIHALEDAVYRDDDPLRHVDLGTLGLNKPATYTQPGEWYKMVFTQRLDQIRPKLKSECLEASEVFDSFGEVEIMSLTNRARPFAVTEDDYLKLLSNCVSHDEFRKNLTAVQFNVELQRLVATDGFRLVALPFPVTEEKMIVPKTFEKLEDETFPQWLSVMPREYTHRIDPIPIIPLIERVQGITRANRHFKNTDNKMPPISARIAVTDYKCGYFNPLFLEQVLVALYRAGTTKIRILFNSNKVLGQEKPLSSKRPIFLVDSDCDSRWALLMPLGPESESLHHTIIDPARYTISRPISDETMEQYLPRIESKKEHIPALGHIPAGATSPSTSSSKSSTKNHTSEPITNHDFIQVLNTLTGREWAMEIRGNYLKLNARIAGDTQWGNVPFKYLCLSQLPDLAEFLTFVVACSEEPKDEPVKQAA